MAWDGMGMAGQGADRGWHGLEWDRFGWQLLQLPVMSWL